MHVRVMLSKYRSYEECTSCGGARLQPEALQWRVGTLQQSNAVIKPAERFLALHSTLSARQFSKLPGLCLHDIMQLPISAANEFFNTFEASLVKHGSNDALTMLIEEIVSRLRYLNDVGLGYLTLDRQSRTLSGCLLYTSDAADE